MSDTSDTRPWCWSTANDEGAHGPFDSREAALADARSEFGSEPAGAQVTLGRCDYLVPEQLVDINLDLMLDNLDDEAADDGWGGLGADKPILEIRGGEKQRQAATDALHVALHVWAREWLVSDCWMMVAPTEDVTL